MKQSEKEFCEFMYEFVRLHIDEVKSYMESSNMTWEDYGATNAIDLLHQIRTDLGNAIWALTELCNWGMGKDYYEEFIEEETDDYTIYKINDKLYKYGYGFSFEEVTESYNEGLWLARDLDGSLVCHYGKPAFRVNRWYSVQMMVVDPKLYPEVTFENSPKKLRV